jgi:hypothetical protein
MALNLYRLRIEAGLPNRGEPVPAPDWATPGPLRVWLRERLIEAGIPFRTMERISTERKGQPASVEGFLEHLPMIREEIGAFR